MIYALMGFLGFGLADFTIVYLTKVAGYLKGMFWNTVFMLTYLTVLLFSFGKQGTILTLTPVEYITASAAGVIATFGTLFFYRGTQEGNISILSPIASTYSVLIVLFSVLFLSEKLSLPQAISIIMVIFGTILVSTNLRNIKDLKHVAKDKSVPYGLMATLFWGASFILIGDMSIKIGWLETDLILTLTSLIVLIIITFYKEKSFSVKNTSAYKIAALIGIFSAMGYGGYSIGVNSVYASIVAPVVAASPLVTVILALVFLKEKLLTEQKIGILLLVSGLVALAF